MNSSQPVALIEIGTNSIKFMVAQKSESLGIRVLFEETVELRIGTGISADDLVFSNDTIEKLISELMKLKVKALRHSVNSIRIIATSAVREAGNQNELSERIKAASDIELAILSGDLEANYIGNAIQLDPYWSQVKNLNLIDLGGGSMECIQINNHTIERATSLPLGAVRLNEQLISNTNNTFDSETLLNVQTLIEAQLKAHSIELSPQTPLLGSGGVFYILQSTFGLQTPIERSALLHLAERLGFETVESRITHYRIPEKRADIFPIAISTLYAFMKSFGIGAIYPSQFNLKYGVLKEMLEL